MYIDPIVVQYPEALDSDRFVIATYYCGTPVNTNALKFGAALAIEQTCGTWLKVPGETHEVRERSIGRVIGVYEAPAYQIGVPDGVNETLSSESLTQQPILVHQWLCFSPQ